MAVDRDPALCARLLERPWLRGNRVPACADSRAILARYGEATLTVWPDLVPTVPGDPGRITLTIE